jgi:hypothetical protein
MRTKILLRFCTFCCLILFSVGCQSQPAEDTIPTWKNAAKGVDVMVVNAPIKSILGDSKLTIIRLKKDSVQAYLKMAVALDSISKTVDSWADTFGFQLVVNAGMYDLSNTLQCRGFMKCDTVMNNSVIKPSYNGVFTIENQKVNICDFNCDPLLNFAKYHSVFQSMRMLDCDGKEMDWKRKKQSCSMLVVGQDNKGYLYFIFTRSPYYHQDMVSFLKQMPFQLGETIYLEGGPETSVYLNTPKMKLSLMGSYVSNTYPTDKNDHFWPLPNVIGFKFQP